MKKYLMGVAGVLLPIATALVVQQLPGEDRIGQYDFKVEIEGVSSDPAFKKIEGISAETEVIDYKTAESNLVRKLPGFSKFGNVTFKRGYGGQTDFYKWWLETASNPESAEMRLVTLTLTDILTGRVQKMNFFEAWPSKWKLSGLDGKGGDILTEEITTAVNGMELNAPGQASDP